MPSYGTTLGGFNAPAVLPLTGALDGVLTVTPVLPPGVVRDRTGDRARVPLGAFMLSCALSDTGKTTDTAVRGADVMATVGTGTGARMTDVGGDGTYTITVPAGSLTDGVPTVVSVTAQPGTVQARTFTLTLTASARG